jgi:hypothetical protein
LVVEPTLSDLEQLLRSARARPRPEFVRELEASVLRSARFGPLAAWRRRESPRLRAALASAVAIATLLLVLSIAGLRPLGTSGTPGAAAERHCMTVRTWSVEREPLFVVARDGRLALRYRTALAPQARIRCR